MVRDALSVTRPSPLRLVGFACTAIGAMLIGLGATMDWATVHVSGVIGTPIPPFKGIDVWEGKVELLASISILVLVIVSRLIGGRTAARATAAIILVVSVGAAALAASDLARADTRFRADDGLERIARSVSARLALPFEEVLAQLKRVAPRLEIRAASGLYVTIAGGVLAALGGILSFAWASRRPEQPPSEGLPAETSGASPTA
jgi:hypothetical protein